MLYQVRIERATHVMPGWTYIDSVGYLCRGRLGLRRNSTVYSSPSAANRAGKTFVSRNKLKRGKYYIYEVLNARDIK